MNEVENITIAKDEKENSTGDEHHAGNNEQIGKNEAGEDPGFANTDQDQQGTQGEQAPEEVQLLPDLPDDIAELKKLVTLKHREAEQNLDQQKRTLAEFVNFRKRVAQEALEYRERGSIDMLLTLAPALDDLEQAVKTADGSDKAQLQKGLELLQQKFRSILATKGIEVVTLNGEPYDPEIAEALTTMAVPDVKPNIVVETYSPAYKHKGIVIRHAKVVVTPSE